MSTPTLPPRRAVPFDPGATLAEPALVWPGRVAVVLGVTLVAGGWCVIVGRTGWAFGAAIVGGLIAVQTVVFGVRSRARAFVVKDLAVALAPHLGLRAPVQGSVQVRRWSGRWVGVPAKVVLTYGPALLHGGPTWMSDLIAELERHSASKFRVVHHRTRRRRIVVAVHSPAAEAEELPDVVRATKLLHGIFGADARIDVETDADVQQLLQIDVSHAMGTKAARPAVRAAIEQTLTALLPGRWRAHWKLTEDFVRFEVRPMIPTAVARSTAPVKVSELTRIPLAVDEDGNDVVWNLKGSGPHLLVSGKTGTGKTVAINGVVLECARRGWQVWIVDPKRIEFMGLRSWPNVQIVATTVVDQIAVIHQAHETMERRYRQIEHGSDESDFEPLVLVLDEYRNFHRQVMAWWASIKVRGMPSRPPVFDEVAAIAEKGRSGRVHLVLGTQRPDADFLTGSMRDNFDSRLALGRLSPQGAQMMWESPYLGVSTPRNIAGRGTGIAADERVEEVQVLWTPDPRRATRDNAQGDLELLEGLRPAEVCHPALRVELGDETDLEGTAQSDWDRVLDARLVAADPSSTPTLELDPARHDAGPHAIAPDVDIDDEDPGDAHTPSPPDGFEGYGPERLTHAARIDAGDLLCTDDALGIWAVVEAVDIDPADDELVCVSWRDDDGGAGDIAMPSDESVTVRRPLDEQDGA